VKILHERKLGKSSRAARPAALSRRCADAETSKVDQRRGDVSGILGLPGRSKGGSIKHVGARRLRLAADGWYSSTADAVIGGTGSGAVISYDLPSLVRGDEEASKHDSPRVIDRQDSIAAHGKNADYSLGCSSALSSESCGVLVKSC